MDGRSSKQAFTASQWQELEHQALIFKYISSGMPIPSDLIINMRRMLNSTISSPSLTFTLQPSTTVGWGCYLGSRKAEDPEPWRCRRTDGKKWRCSKEAHVDSKYCERHMHRGKNRSRKPVEINVSQQPKIYPYPISSGPPGSTGLQTSLLDNYGNHRYSNGGESAFMPHIVTEGRSPVEFKPLKKAEEEQCFVLGADFKLGKPVEEEEGAQQPLRRFFDERPQKTKNSWVDVEEGFSKTQLSISTPMTYHHRT